MSSSLNVDEPSDEAEVAVMAYVPAGSSLVTRVSTCDSHDSKVSVESSVLSKA